MRPLSVLFTNNTLSHRHGSELWVRDVAIALLNRRHQPIAFSLVLGAIADELRAATVPIVSDLANIAAPPDVIHGHHHVETLIAALHFPTTPIIHFCHGWLPWEERPLKHPSIVRYVAVDETCADRLTMEEGIPADRVEVLFNFVDLERFAPRAPLPVRPRRALIFSNQALEGGHVAAIREACREAAIDVTVAGQASGVVLEHPEHDLREFDLVFAKARCALEALAVGCSVIVTDLSGAGPLVTSSEFDYLRARNFGIRVLREAHAVDWYRRQIAAYDRDDAAAVTALVRGSAGLDHAVDRLLEIYSSAIDIHAAARSGDDGSIAAQRAAARHLCEIAPAIKTAHVLQRDREALRARLTVTERALADCQHERDDMQRHAPLEQELLNTQELVHRYQGLTVVRLRDAVLRVPVLGRAAARAVRLLRPLL